MSLPEAGHSCEAGGNDTSVRIDEPPRVETPPPPNPCCAALAAAVHACQVEESWGRSLLLGEEHTSRGDLAESAMSLSEPGLYVCPPPHTAEFYASFLKRKRLELTEKYQHLVTRQMLREDRWLEYTVALLQELVEEEATARDQLIQSSLQDIPRLTLCHLQLQMISAQGTEGTVIYVEEMEREIRFRVMIFDEIEAFEALVASEVASRTECVRLEEERQAAEADARGCVGAAEWNARWLVEREEEKAWDPLVALAPVDRHRIHEMLLWRVMCSEADVRQEMEHEWQQSLYPTTVSRSDEDEDARRPDEVAAAQEDRDVPNPSCAPLAALVASHHRLCDAHQEEVRRHRAERAEAQSVAALAFHYARPILPEDERAVGTVEDPDDDTLVLFGHRFDRVPPARPAGECPVFVPPTLPSAAGSPTKRKQPPPRDWSMDQHGVSPSEEEGGGAGSDDDEDDEEGRCSLIDIEHQAMEVAALWAALDA